MLVLLPKAAQDLWLDGGQEQEHLLALLLPYRTEVMIAYPVGIRVNSPHFDDAECIAAVM